MINTNIWREHFGIVTNDARWIRKYNGINIALAGSLSSTLDEIDRLTEQLRLANEDAERLYWHLQRREHCGLPVLPDEASALRLHEERIAQESE